jgi:hypothetical protein
MKASGAGARKHTLSSDMHILVHGPLPGTPSVLA